MSTQSYIGEELRLFENATNWKEYILSVIEPFIMGEVLEVGAGIGSTSKVFNEGSSVSWSLLEPDSSFYMELKKKKSEGYFKPNTRILNGTLKDVPAQEMFDCILYIDVLEHLEKDDLELQLATNKLNDGGKLIVLSPAFMSLYSPFDSAIGHYRRYRKRDFIKFKTPSLKLVKAIYLDSMGYFASLVNRLFLRQQYPTLKQVIFWDKYLVPASKISDRLTLNSFGKSILGIWEKTS